MGSEADLLYSGLSATGIRQSPIKGVSIGGATDTLKHFWASKCTGSAGQRIELGVVRRIRQQKQKHDIDRQIVDGFKVDAPVQPRQETEWRFESFQSRMW